MNKLFVSKSAEKRLAQGIQILDRRDFKTLHLDDCLVSLYSVTDKFLGTSYLSKQNKGIGWLLSREKITFDKSYLITVFKQAREKRQLFESSELTTAYRLVNQDGDHLGGVTIDRYNDYALFSWYNPFVYDNRDLILSAFQEVFPEFLGGYEKIRFKGLDYESAHLYGQEAPDTFEVLENGVRYSVFLNEGLMTGIFLDQHDVRGMLVDGMAQGKNSSICFLIPLLFQLQQQRV